MCIKPLISTVPVNTVMIFHFSTEVFFTFHRVCGEKIGKKPLSPAKTENRPGDYRQELMFAVMSRILFCMLVSPFFRATSTFRMAYNTVV